MPKRDRAPRSLRTVGLFAGIGGIERGLEQAGHETVLLCENDLGAAAVLEHHWRRRPEPDIRSLSSLPEETELVAAGFPCTDLSQAGMTAGIGGERSGLVNEVFRLLEAYAEQQGRPVPWVLFENVPFMLRLDRGRGMAHLIDRLERLGYRWAYRIVDTRAFGLPQRRQRVLLLASAPGEPPPRDVLLVDDVGPPVALLDPEEWRHRACGFYWTEGNRGLGWVVGGIPTLKSGSTIGIPSPPAVVLPGGRVVCPTIEAAEALQGFDPGWTRPAAEVVRERLRWRYVGNAVSVPVARWVGERLAHPGRSDRLPARPLAPGDPWPSAAWGGESGSSVWWSTERSAWPCRRDGASLEAMVQDRWTPLSSRATAGFLDRLERSSLRCTPGFVDVLRAHLARMERGD